MFAAGGLIGARNQAIGHAALRDDRLGDGLWRRCVMAALTLARGERFGFEWTLPYIASLLYLTVLGSGAVFALYFTVVERIGAEKASYATVLFPLVALAVSTVAEGYHWPALALIGVPLAVLGNALVLTRRTAPARLPAPGRGSQGQPHALEGPVDADFPEPDSRA